MSPCAGRREELRVIDCGFGGLLRLERKKENGAARAAPAFAAQEDWLPVRAEFSLVVAPVLCFLLFAIIEFRAVGAIPLVRGRNIWLKPQETRWRGTGHAVPAKTGSPARLCCRRSNRAREPDQAPNSERLCRRESGKHCAGYPRRTSSTPALRRERHGGMKSTREIT